MKLLKTLCSVLFALTALAGAALAVLVLLDDAKRRRYVRIDAAEEE